MAGTSKDRKPTTKSSGAGKGRSAPKNTKTKSQSAKKSTGNNSRTGAKSSSAKTGTIDHVRKDRGGDPTLMRHQLAPYILALAALFLVICYIVSDSTGFIGGFLKKALFGLFSGAAWAVPLLLVNLAVFWKRDIASGAIRYKCVFSFLCLDFISVLVCVFTRREETFNIGKLFTDGTEGIGGGVIGGLLGNALLRGFGKAGTLILIIALILLFGIFLFGMTPQMFVMYIMQGVRQWKNGMNDQLEASRIEREAIRLEYDKRRIAERQQALHERQEQLRSRTPNVNPDPSGRRFTDPLAGSDLVLDMDEVPRRKKNAGQAVSQPAESVQPVEPVQPVQNQPDAPVETADTAKADVDPDSYVDEAVFDEIKRREEEKRGRMSKPAPEENPEQPQTSDDEIESDAPPFAKENENKTEETEEPVKLSFFRREKIKPLPKTEGQKLKELEQESDEIDLKKIFAEPTGEQDAVDTDIPDSSPEVVDPENGNDFATSATLDLVVEKSQVGSSGAADSHIDLPMSKEPAPEPILPDDDEDEDDEPPFDTDNKSPANFSAASTSKGSETVHIAPEKPVEYRFPPIPLLNYDPAPPSADMSGEIQQTAVKLVETLRSFNVKTKIINVSRGPTVTRYELQPEVGTKVRSILNLVDDIALHLATSGVRIEAPIPGKEAVGIEVPNKNASTVYIRELIEDPAFKNAPSKVTTCLGEDVGGNPVFLDVAKMPHLLIAGTTGSGKSVCINSLIISILYKARPDEVKFILIDPKKVELNPYNGIPHLLVPVVSDPKKAAGSLHWAVTEMERRYELIEGAGVRNLKGYNKSIENDPDAERLPLIVIVIDELADLMMMAKDDVEDSIIRIAQKARAAGIHLIIGTQRPSVDVITGLIKANVPSRIAFTTMSQVDSRTIIDTAGAEKLIGRGDMLYAPIGSMKPTRVQGAFVSDDEVEAVTEFIKNNTEKQDYDQSVMDTIEREAELCGNKKATTLGDGDEEANDGDPMLKPAIQLAVESGKISTSLIQRRLQLGYGRAAKLIDTMEDMGIVGPPQGQKPREVLISKQEYMEMELRRE